MPVGNESSMKPVVIAWVLLIRSALGITVGLILWRDRGWKPWIGGALGAVIGPEGIFTVWLYSNSPGVLAGGQGAPAGVEGITSSIDPQEIDTLMRASGFLREWPFTAGTSTSHSE
jgi:hypothetical protein